MNTGKLHPGDSLVVEHGKLYKISDFDMSDMVGEPTLVNWIVQEIKYDEN